MKAPPARCSLLAGEHALRCRDKRGSWRRSGWGDGGQLAVGADDSYLVAVAVGPFVRELAGGGGTREQVVVTGFAEPIGVSLIVIAVGVRAVMVPMLTKASACPRALRPVSSATPSRTGPKLVPWLLVGIARSAKPFGTEMVWVWSLR